MCRKFTYLVSFVLLLGAVLNTAAEAADPSLVGWWKLDDASGTTAIDSSGNNNNGTLINGPVWAAGYLDGALQFDGTNDYVDCGNGSSLHITGSVTITAWVKLAALGGDQKVGGNQDGTTGGYKMGIYSDNTLEFEIRTSGGSAILNRGVAGGTVLTQGVWYHVAGVYSQGNYIRTYVNGKPERNYPTAEILGASSGTFKLGCEPFTTNGSL